MPPGYEMIIFVCFCVFHSNYECNVCHSPAHDRVITSAHSAQTSDCRYFWFPSNLKDKPECRAGFLQRGDAALLHAEEVKYIKGSSAGDLGFCHMLIPCETRRAPFFTPPCKGRFQMEVAKKQKCQDLAFISPVIWKKGNDKNLRREGKTHTIFAKVTLSLATISSIFRVFDAYFLQQKWYKIDFTFSMYTEQS